MGEARANVALAWLDKGTSFAVRPDPRFVTIEMLLGRRASDYSTEEIRAATMTTISESTHPQYFQSGSFASKMAEMSDDGSTEIMALADPFEVTLIDNAASFTSNSLSVQIKKCDSAKRADCAPENELTAYL